MKRDKAIIIDSIKADLGRLIVDFHPESKDEWTALESIIAAHRTLRKIDLSTLIQLDLPIGISNE